MVLRIKHRVLQSAVVSNTVYPSSLVLENLHPARSSEVHTAGARHDSHPPGNTYVSANTWRFTEATDYCQSLAYF